VFNLNSAAAKIFLLCDGNRSECEIAIEISKVFETHLSLDQIQLDVRETIQMYQKIGAII
jgi:hypothetical protein